MCTKLDIINTGINIDTVNESKWKVQLILNNSISIHLNNSMCTSLLLIPTSINAIIENIVVIIEEKHVIVCDPFTPTFLPQKPATIDANKGKNIIFK